MISQRLASVAFLAGSRAAGILLSRLLMAMGCIHDYLTHPMRQDSDPVRLHLERRSRLAALLPAVLNHLSYHHHPHTPLVQPRPALGVPVPPFHIGPEASPVHDLTVFGNQVIEPHIEPEQRAGRLVVTHGKGPNLRIASDIPLTVEACAHGSPPWSLSLK